MRDSTNLRDQLSRRQYAQLLAGIGTVGLAGCPSGGGTDSTDEPGETDDAAVTPTATPTGETEAPPDTDADTDSPTPLGEPATDVVRVFQANSPDVFDANVWAPQDNTTGVAFMTDLQAVRNVHTRQMAYSGVEFETPWKPRTDSVSVMTWYSGYEVDAPYDVYESHDDRATYWNGDPLDADARETHFHVDYFQAGNKFTEDTAFTQEAASQWEYHWWNTDGSDGLPDDAQAQHILASQAAPNDGDMPIHPDFTQPYLEQYRDAGTADAVSAVTDDLVSDRISLQRLLENGWGSGPYEIRSEDGIGSAELTLHLRDEAAAEAGDTVVAHPNAANTNVPKLAIQWGDGERRQTLASNGAIDLNGNIVAPNGLYSRETLPDHMQELTRWLRSEGGDKWRLNWNNPHLQNLWVRRALVAAVDWTAAGANGWGDARSVPIENHTYMLDAQSQSVFSGEFLDSLHSWPMESDTEAAAEYLRRGGYSKQGDQWVDPNGNPAAIDVIFPSAIADYAGAAQTIRANLAEIGFGINFSSQGWSTWSNNLRADNGLNYDSSIFWHGYGEPFGYYNSSAGWVSGSLVMGKAGAPAQRVDPDTEVDAQGKPLQVEIPSEVGAIEAPDEAGIDPDLSDGEEINLAGIVREIREPGKSEAEIQELYRKCARYYNYYLPHFVFHQYNWGAWGNVRDFEWPDPGHRGFDFERGFGISTAMILGGLVEASYDTGFQPPE
ncbi:ABC transporter substrate-binding protein [Halosimplex carlsbadense]|uniref:ABC transporter substrate-binding protein n=1 Tax=Halosimplex carlsbadense TaxID=171164 RepID=UPI0006782AAE|nr:ABC transporter substrate-binding protein [Halosimplex carlsbadense]